MDASETDDESIVGEACHMVASSPDGPRGDSPLTAIARDKYSNLLLLCNIHHKQIDDQPGTFTLEKLATIKHEHENWVKVQLEFDASKQRDDEFYAGLIDEWSSRIDLDNWMNRASAVICNGQPSIDIELLKALEDIRAWLLSRHWPGRYPQLEAAFHNFRHVTQDFCMTFKDHAELKWKTTWQTEKFYKIREWNPKLYSELSREFDYHVDLVCDLMLELTRAINYINIKVREHLIPSYRSIEGVTLIQSGPHMDLSYKTYRVEYRGDERTEQPYPGLARFKTIRAERDINFGREPAEA
jgi:hypothetical protein